MPVTALKKDQREALEKHLWRCLYVASNREILPQTFQKYKEDNFHDNHLKKDSNSAQFAGRVLEIINDKIIYQDLPELWSQELLPLRTDLPIVFAEETTFYGSFRGKPRFSTATGDNIPKVAYELDNQSHKIAIFELAIDVTWQELRTVAFATASSLFPTAFNLLEEKLKAVRRGLAEFVHYTLLYGDADHQLNGVLDHPDVPVISALGTFNPYTVASNQAALLNEWFTITLLEALQDATNEQVEVNTLLIPTKLKNKLNNTFQGDDGDSAMTLLRNSLPGLNIKSIVELRTDYLRAYGLILPNENQHRLVIGEFSSDVLDTAVSQVIDNPWGDMGGSWARKTLPTINSIGNHEQTLKNALC